jgi:branched-chain amino acid transport system ATP-binding protein
LLYVIAASSLRCVYLSGQISIGQGAFLAVGAYASAVLATKFGWSPWASVPVGALAGLALAAVAGAAFCRLTSIYFAMGTFFFGVAVQAAIAGLPKYTGGSSGLTGVPTFPTINLPGDLHIDFGASSSGKYYLFLIITAVSLLVLYRLGKGRIGMTWRGVAQSGKVAESVGINESAYKVLAFALGGFFTGLAGACLAHQMGTISTGSFGAMTSIYLLAYVLVGGTRSFAGPLLGAVVLLIIPEFYSGLREYTPFVVAATMLLVVFVLHNGFIGLVDQVRSLAASASARKGRAKDAS